MLDQGAVGIEQELRVVERASVALVDADGRHQARLFAGLADGLGDVRRDGDGLLEQPLMLRRRSGKAADEGEVGVVRHHRLGEGGELHALAPRSRICRMTLSTVPSRL